MKNRWIMMTGLLLGAGVANAGYVTIENTGNADDSTGYGGVNYSYKISAQEVTISQMNASGAGSGNEGYWNDGTRTVGTDAPAVYVSLSEARQYCNYLTTGDVNSGYYGAGGTNMSSKSHISYATDNAPNGYTYFLPTEDEWYKAAYYDASGANGYSLYANGAGTVPAEGGGSTGWDYNNVNSSPNYTRDTALGTTEQNGTVNMMGNVWEWMEDSSGVVRGGGVHDDESYLRSSYRLVSGVDGAKTVGFRTVEAIPEPMSIAFLGLFGGGVIAIRRIFMI